MSLFKFNNIYAGTKVKKLLCFTFILVVTTTFSQPLECIPHHIGESNWPANTVYALNHSIKKFPFNNATLVLSSDGYPIVFHGFDLAKTTNGTGDPESYNLKYLKTLDAAYMFNPEAQYPLRNKDVKIPTLKELLFVLPNNPKYKLILDLKSHHNQQLVSRVVETINSLDHSSIYWNRIIFYSTEKGALSALRKLEPKAQVFLDRQTTLEILLNNQVTRQQREDIANFNWVGFEMQRNLCERFTLGENCAQVNQLWTKNKIAGLKDINPNINIVVFAADSSEIQLKAKEAGADYMYVNAPNNSQICQ